MDVFFLFYFRLLLLDWQLQRRAPSAVLHLKVIGHSVCCVLPYFLKEHILSAKDNTRQLHRDNCLYLIFIFFAINAFHQHFFVLVCRCWSRRRKKSKTFPQNSRSCSTAASIMKCEMIPAWFFNRWGSSYLFFSVSRLFSWSNKWLHSELKRDPFKQRATLLSIRL